MSAGPASPLFVDTSALYARLDESDANHERARAVFDGIRDGALPYRPLYVTGHVLGEFVTLTMHNLGVTAAIDSLGRLRESSLFATVHPGEEAFDAASRQLASYDDQQITLVDHLTAVLADDRDVAEVFTFDDDFRTLGFTIVPDEIGLP